LAERLQRRLHLITQERIISSQPPRVRGGMIVVPHGLLRERIPVEKGQSLGAKMSGDPTARRVIEGKAMDAVMAAERALGNQPEDVSAQKVGYDIASHDPEADHMRFIEVKGRVDGADTVMITRQEVITSLHEPRKFILAIVQVESGVPHHPRYVYGALDTREPRFDQSAIQFNLKSLLERAEEPH
ncbi:MAG TPA: RNA helicase, partial [Synechococcus sp. UBA8638]|nr:RNA helicase [Synechococcus sp. UBA8638]